MEYKATFKSMLGLTVILLTLSILSLFNGVVFNEPLMSWTGIILLIVLITMRVRFSVFFDDHVLRSTGFFSTKTLRWDEITKVVSMIDSGFPKNRFYGPSVYEFSTKRDNLKINFKLFPIECENKILSIAGALASVSTERQGACR